MMKYVMKLSTANFSGNVKLTSESMERQKVFDTDPDMHFTP